MRKRRRAWRLPHPPSGPSAPRPNRWSGWKTNRKMWHNLLSRSWRPRQRCVGLQRLNGLWPRLEIQNRKENLHILGAKARRWATFVMDSLWKHFFESFVLDEHTNCQLWGCAKGVAVCLKFEQVNLTLFCRFDTSRTIPESRLYPCLHRAARSPDSLPSYRKPKPENTNNRELHTLITGLLWSSFTWQWSRTASWGSEWVTCTSFIRS